MISSTMGLALLFLGVSVLFVPIFQKFGLGAVLGYLIAGVLIGPGGLAWVRNVDSIAHFSELGVVLLLFIIGLELEPKKLWTLRYSIFGLGTLQVLLTTLAFFAFGVLVLSYPWPVALVVGMAFSLSSTAIVVQLMNDRGILPTTAGQKGFSILLFQDIVVIPMTALLPLLAPATTERLDEMQLPVWAVILILISVTLLGRFLLRPILRWVASTHLREVFTALALLLVVGMAASMQALGLSMGLGSFMAGVLLADSEYKHALETDIEPFKGLLLGLFFIAVGMSLDTAKVLAEPITILLAVCGVLLIKIALLFVLGKAFGVPKLQLLFFALTLSQIGEFAFVLLGTSRDLSVLTQSQFGFFSAVVAISMLSTPVLAWIYSRWIEPHIGRKKSHAPHDVIEDQSAHVIIAGFGRFGQIVARLMYANRVPVTVLDHEPDQIEMVRRFGFKVYFGDATRLDLLESAGAMTAKALVVAIDDVNESLKLVDLVRERFPGLKLFCRARNVQHYFDLVDRGVEHIDRETFESSLSLGVKLLSHLGFGAYEAHRSAQIFRQHNVQMLRELARLRADQGTLVAKAKSARDDLETLMEKEQAYREASRSSWNAQ